MDDYHPMPTPASTALAATVAAAAGGVRSAAAPQQLACCPICYGDLCSNTAELGALTQQGKRLEQSIYHAGCVTMMLCHTGRVLNADMLQPEISWGVSPVTRKPVDGFMRMPLLRDRTAWFQFADWKCDGQLDVEELAAICSAMLPIDENSADDFVRQTFGMGPAEYFVEADMESRIVPVLESNAVTSAARGLTQYAKAIADMRRLGNAALRTMTLQLQPLRATSRFGSEVAAAMVTRGIGDLVLEHFSADLSRPSFCDVDLATKALGGIAPRGDPFAVELLCRLFASADETIRATARAVLPRVAGRASPAQHIILRYVRHKAVTVKELAVDVLGDVSMRGDPAAINGVKKAMLDRDAGVRRAAVHTLGMVSPLKDWSSCEALLPRLSDVAREVRIEAGMVFSQLAPRSEKAISAVRNRLLKTTFVEDRETLMSCLANIASRGDTEVLKAITAQLGDECRDVRRAAVSAISSCANHGDWRSLRAIAKVVHEDLDAQVVFWGIRALQKLANAGDNRALEALASRFGGDGDSWKKAVHRPTNAAIKYQAVKSFGELARVGDEWAFQKILALTSDTDYQMRIAALETTVRIAGTSDQFAEIRAVAKSINQLDVFPTAKIAAQKVLAGLDDVERSRAREPPPPGFLATLFASFRCRRRRCPGESSLHTPLVEMSVESLA